MFFGAMQAPGRAKLILIKGEGMDGVSYVLSATEHVAGRVEGAILFPEDPLLSPRHANFIYRDGKLFVRDEGSVNGIFVRIIRPQTVQSGTTFLVGEQLLRVESCPPETVLVPDADGTYFYGSPRRPSKLTLTQLLAGGNPGMIFRARDDTLTIGREGNDINFPDDPFISGRHATVQAMETPSGTRFQIADLGSKNGTFVRIPDEAPLFHGDYVFLGQQLLRVEIT
jgi:pSer/pThr/pTyr-binding forkhead associated (FHA) protein